VCKEPKDQLLRTILEKDTEKYNRKTGRINKGKIKDRKESIVRTIPEETQMTKAKTENN
jgi:hypothetical protein